MPCGTAEATHRKGCEASLGLGANTSSWKGKAGSQGQGLPVCLCPTHLQEFHHVQLGVSFLLLCWGLAEQLCRVHLVPFVVLSYKPQAQYHLNHTLEVGIRDCQNPRRTVVSQIGRGRLGELAQGYPDSQRQSLPSAVFPSWLLS